MYIVHTVSIFDNTIMYISKEIQKGGKKSWPWIYKCILYLRYGIPIGDFGFRIQSSMNLIYILNFLQENKIWQWQMALTRDKNLKIMNCHPNSSEYFWFSVLKKWAKTRQFYNLLKWSADKVWLSFFTK